MEEEDNFKMATTQATVIMSHMHNRVPKDYLHYAIYSQQFLPFLKTFVSRMGKIVAWVLVRMAIACNKSYSVNRINESRLSH